jgi:uncharacterized membrane protein YfcA
LGDFGAMIEPIWILGFFAAVLVGFTKTGLPGMGMLVVPLMAGVFPAKLSVGAVLPMLIVADVFAVGYYRRHAQWNHLVRLLPFVLVGMVPGWWVLLRIESEQLKPVLGGLVLVLVTLELARRRWSWERVPGKWWFAPLTGALAGFATTIGNAAGPIMALYLLNVRLPKRQFMGTAAWYFMIINWLKVPLFVSAKVITSDTLRFDLFAVPMLVVGAIVGVRVLPKIPQALFNVLVLLLAAGAAVHLILI